MPRRTTHAPRAHQRSRRREAELAAQRARADALLDENGLLPAPSAALLAASVVAPIQSREGGTAPLVARVLLSTRPSAAKDADRA